MRIGAVTLLVVGILGGPPAVRGQSPGELRFISLSAGGAHACGISTDSLAYCWGSNQYGQLGDSTNTDRPAPVRVATDALFRAITAGEWHTCAIATDDTPYCWGRNNHGQLGVGGTGDRNLPRTVTYSLRRMGKMRVSVMSAGGEHTCALVIHRERQDHVFCWGDNSSGQLGVRGQVGGGTNDIFRPINAFGTIRYSAVAAGVHHTCAIASTVNAGSVFCWGENGKGQMGNGSRTSSAVPFPVRLRGRTFSSVTVGTTHSCALTVDGEAFCWGDNSAGQLGTGKGGANSPASLGDSLRLVALSARGETTCGVDREGRAVCWGANASGQFGGGPPEGGRTPTVVLPGLTLASIALGRTQACGLRSDGAVYCWGQATGGGEGAAEPRRVALP